MWDEWDNHNYLQRQQQQQQQQPQPQQQTAEEAESTSSESEEQQQREEKQSHLNFDFLSVLAKPKDYYRILEVDYDATEEAIRSNYIRLALKWHPDKQKDQDCATSIFQEINEAYQGKILFFFSFSYGLDFGFSFILFWFKFDVLRFFFGICFL